MRSSTNIITPNFLVVGGQRCGTTWLDRALRSHPQIFLPANKQSYFFDAAYEKGFDWYISRFQSAQRDHIAIGEVATGYALPSALPRMHSHLPDIKIIVAVRNPVDRAYSYFKSRSVTYGWKKFDEAVEQEPDILVRGRYVEQIEQLYELYRPENVLVLFYDDLVTDDRKYLKRVLNFLEVDASVESPVTGTIVQTSSFGRIRRIVKTLGLNWLLDLVSASWIGDAVRKRIASNKRTVGTIVPEQLRSELAGYYAPLNHKLGTLMERDLSHWNE